MPRWIRRRPGPEENRKAAAVAAGVGAAIAAVVFYFARMFLARERIDRVPRRDEARGTRRDGEGEAG